MRRWFWIITFAVLPFTRRWLWRPHGGPDEHPTEPTPGPHHPDRFRYYCWSCNHFTTDTGGYSGYMSGYRELCKACWQRRRRWSLLYWLETGETVTFPCIDGDGVISPSTTRSTCTAKVYRLLGFEFVGRKAFAAATKSIDGASYWLRRLRVDGDSETVRRIRKMNEHATRMTP